MGGAGLIKGLLKSAGIYSRSAVFFLIVALIGWGFIYFNPLKAADPLDVAAENVGAEYDVEIDMKADGRFFVGRSELERELTVGTKTHLYRLKVVDRPKNGLEKIDVALHLPKPVTDDLIAHRFSTNGGAVSATSQLVDPQTLVFSASEVSTEAVLTIQVEVPKSYVSTSALFNIQQKVATLPLGVWITLSVAFPVLTLLLLFLVALARGRKVADSTLPMVTDLPSRLPPAMLGILLRGRITNRELAATLVDLARRGHLVIRQATANDFRFTRLSTSDKLEDFEAEILDQIFGPVAQKANSEEMSFTLAQELFSKRISQAFMLAYKKVNDLGYFYTNPLTLHRRYQIAGMSLFLLGVVGFFTNLVLFPFLKFFLLFWVSMMAAALLVTHFSKGLPVRSVFGDRELARWLAFRKFLTSQEPINYAAHSQEKYLAYLPYAIIFEVEPEWTRRFYDLPFTQPHWYVAQNISTIDDFSNKIFPLFGYLAHTLALSSEPASR